MAVSGVAKRCISVAFLASLHCVDEGIWYTGVWAGEVESHRERIKRKLKLSSGAALTVRAAQWVLEQ